MSETTTEVDNLLRIAMQTAADRARTAQHTLSPSGANPVEPNLRALHDAWRTDPATPTRDRFEDELREAGRRILGALVSLEDGCRSEARNEPVTVPQDDWRARFEARGPSWRPYW